ncbi:hypothetical protein [Campylobacter sp. CCS1377]|uniref:Uncharacterized protein n=1 Tax=Campylobacter sp. CCS1377 TaxID=3158229 RepID=A0AAU7EA12_9BACT|nr:hypothetical protein [Campylobacter jejuni]
MADFSVFKNKYNQYEDTLKNTSYDKENDKYLCLKENRVINFENLSLSLETNKGVKKVDALFCQTNNVFLVEFKNQKQSNVDKQEIIQKFKDSIILLKKLFKENNIAFKNYIIYLYLVIKDGNNSQIYKKRQIGNEIEYAMKADDFLNKFEIKCDPRQSFLPIYQRIFNERCEI